jgi:hypothetical protein
MNGSAGEVDESTDADAPPVVSRSTRPTPIAHHAPARRPAQAPDEDGALPRAS